MKVASEIVRRQQGFFESGVAAMRPLTLREVAEAIEMHESTVSRVTQNKYLLCDRGMFELKYFFGSGVGSGDGEGAAAEAVKSAIGKLIAAETERLRGSTSRGEPSPSTARRWASARRSSAAGRARSPATSS
jgi:RNA polymerase sigma-54 factor